MKIFEWIDVLFERVILTPINALKASVERVSDWNYTVALEWCKTVSALEVTWEQYPDRIKEDPDVLRAYEEKKKELTAEGALTPANLAGGFVGKGVKWGVDSITKAALDNIQPVIDDFFEGYKGDPKDKEIVNKLAASGEFGLNAVVGFMLGHFLSPVISTSLAPAWETMGQEVWKRVPVRLLDEGRLLYLIYRYPEEAETYKEELKRKGYSDERIKELEKAFLYYPTPRDFIHYAVRETYDDTVAKDMGYDEHYPEAMEADILKAGMDPSWLKHEWRAHWAMISPRMAYEMLQREEIDMTMLTKILTIADYPPALIPKLINISYARIGRIDLRRLYSTGEIDFDGMERGYRHLGYSPEDAEKIATWTDKEYARHDKDIAMGKLMKGYNLGEISTEICLEKLILIGYDEDESRYLIALEDYKLEEKRKEDEAETLVEEVVNGTKTLEELETALKSLILRPKEIAKYRDKAKRKVRALITQPTEAKLTKWVKAGIIDFPTYEKRLAALRYSPEDIVNFVMEVKSE